MPRRGPPHPHCLENELNGDIDALSNSELKKLLRRKGIPVSKMGKHAKRKVLLLYKRIVEEGKDIDGTR